MRTKLLIVLVLINNLTFSQLSDTYKEYSKIATSYFNKKDYVNATAFYSMAFKTMHDKGSPDDRYNAAIAYSSINQIDSAFKNLIRLAERTEFLDCEKIETQEAFIKLKTEARWKIIRDLTCGTNYELHKVVEKIYYDDQTPRTKIDSISNKFGYNSKQADSLWNVIRYNDSINLAKIDSIHRIHGWPSAKLVGRNCNIAFWLVIQHSNINVQVKYLPFMQQAVLNGNARPLDCAYLEDRILMNKKFPQKYGTQYQYKVIDNKKSKSRLYKLQDKERVNKYRQEVGLAPLSKQDLEDALEIIEVNNN